MFAAITPVIPVDDPDAAFVVEYRRPMSYLQSQAWKIVAGLAAVVVIVVLLQPYGDLDIQRRAAAGGREATTSWSVGWSIVLGIAAIALAIDFAMLAKRILAGLPALVIDDAGVIGYWWGWPTEIAFADVDQVVPEDNRLTIFARPRGGLFRALFPSSAHDPGGRWDFRPRIVVPLDYVDRGQREIIEALTRRLPANSG